MLYENIIKISIISDLFLDDWDDQNAFFPNTNNSKLLVIAGNVSRNPDLVMDFFSRHEYEYPDVVGCSGVLEYCNDSLFHKNNLDIEASFTRNMKVIGCPCWPRYPFQKDKVLTDERSLWNESDYTRARKQQHKVVRDINPDLLITSFPNLYRAIDNEVISPSIWVHGNSRSSGSAMVGKTRVASNSRLRPKFSKYNHKDDYKPLVISFDNYYNRERYNDTRKDGVSGEKSIITRSFTDNGLHFI